VADRNNFRFVADPLKFKNILWPNVTFYKQQREIIYSVAEDDETVVPAANKMGKDFVAAFIVLWFFITRHPVRIITTSAKDDHLRVLWGEIMNFVNTAKYPLAADKGGLLVLNHQDMRKIVRGEKCPISYCTGMVAKAETIAAMQGHHVAETGDGIPRTLFVCDESSSVPHDYKKMADTWANRQLIFGNTWPCNNFFFQAVKGSPDGKVKGGDIPRDDSPGFERRVIRIKAEDSPNVRYGLEEVRQGQRPTNRMLIPGVKSYTEYVRNRRRWDKIQQTVSLDADFYQGAEVLMYPPDWLARAKEVADRVEAEHRRAVLEGIGHRRRAKGMGVDPAEGGDKTTLAVSDELGLMDLISLKTPDTQAIIHWVLAMMKKYSLKGHRVVFDRGGGGKQLADQLRKRGYRVRTVGFGEKVGKNPAILHKLPEDVELDTKEAAYTYLNRRAQLFGRLRELLDPDNNPAGFGIPRRFKEVHQQLAPIPLIYDGEGRLYLLPKRKKNPNSKEKTLVDLIGHSPDEADAVALSIYAMTGKVDAPVAGAMW
jgi:hypothetical protein